ncbi:MAG: hypothetical protein RIK87_15305 [Fuerstiella sp.]
MSIYNSHRRFYLSVWTAVGFAVVYVGFRAVTSPFLDVERQKHHVSTVADTEVLSPDVRGDAEKWFVDHPWVARSGKHFRDNGRYLFCETFEIEKDGHAIVVRPVAMLWRSETEDVPVTIVADSAELRSSTRFSLEDAELGRITNGIISGNVQIRGPRALKIDGGTFRLEDAPMRLWSSEQVDFKFDGHTGAAQSGVEILMNSSGADSDGLTDISKVQLLGRVLCNFVVPGKRPIDEPLRASVNAARGFVFDVPTRTGTFSGYSATSNSRGNADRLPRTLVPRDEVWLRRLNTDGSTDELVCPELKLTFRNATDPVTGEPSDSRMQLEHVQAWGRLVEFHSPQQDLHIRGNDFQYSVDQRRIDLWHTTNDMSDTRKFVHVKRGASQLVVPHIRILHTPTNDLQRIECNGLGGLKGTTDVAEAEQGGTPEDAPPSEFEARWGQSLTIQAAPDGLHHYLTMEGGATIADLTQNIRLSARKLAMTMISSPPSDPASAAQPGSATVPAEATLSTGIDSVSGGLFPESIRPSLLIATDNVVVRSGEGNGTLRQNLTVRFQQETAASRIHTVSATQTAPPLQSPGGPDTAVSEDLSFISDAADVLITLPQDRQDDRIPPYNVWLKGNVEVTRQTPDHQNDFFATGNQLLASGSSEKARTIHLFGDPARVSSLTRNLEGPRIDLHELQGRAEVVGSGRIRFVTTTGFDGKALPEPTPLDIYWSDHMSFQQRSAEFVGKVRVVMSDGRTQDLEVLCAGLTVHFSRDVTLDSSDEGTFQAVDLSAGDEAEKENPIERLECHNRVEVRIDQFEAGSVTGRHRAVFADLKVNLKSGDFEAVGPGALESTSPDKGGRLQGGSPVTVRPNTPSQTSETVFVYLKTEFVGGVTGNIERREATLSHNVVALMTPARRVDEKINLQQIPTDELPERAGILQAETVTFGAIWGRDGAADSFSIVCRRNARLESRSISASADVITYDHGKEQFIIRAEDGNSVNVNHRTGNGRFNRTSGNRFEYYRQTNQLKADKVRALNLSQ